MPIAPVAVLAAAQLQTAAANDASPKIRLVAVPGAGKSQSIKERVGGLLQAGVMANRIRVVSFTNIATKDLQSGIHAYCTSRGITNGVQVRVSTLHSLALGALRAAGVLNGVYPVLPSVLDDWEIESVFEAEFRNNFQTKKKRAEEIRRDHEGFWSTGGYSPPMTIPPNPPITVNERQAFANFHGPRSVLYSCVLAGEIVRLCVSRMAAGTLDPVRLLQIEHLIVDEYQDLNPVDVEFVDRLANLGAKTFVCGDDDQSIYSFRFGSPVGIQQFPTRHPGASLHSLPDCFRCAPAIANAASTLIANSGQAGRITKQLRSLWNQAAPTVSGIFHRWTFPNAFLEAHSVADSCAQLIAAGVQPDDIVILLSKESVLRHELYPALQHHHVPHVPARFAGLASTDSGKVVQCLLRLVQDLDDFVAYRVLFGLVPQVGIGTCDSVAHKAVQNNIQYRTIFTATLPPGVFTKREATLISTITALFHGIAGWTTVDTLQTRAAGIQALLTVSHGVGVANDWALMAAAMPSQSTLGEVLQLLRARSLEEQWRVTSSVHTRLGLQLPPNPASGMVRVLTLHSSKGLSARVVFVPGLEEGLLPTDHARPYPQQIAEAARLLYVGITRARAACVVSYAEQRYINGQLQNQVPSRFCQVLGGAFVRRGNGLSANETQQIGAEIARM